MTHDTNGRRPRARWSRWLLAATLMGLAASAGASLPALAQGFTWPWEEEEPRRPPRERPRQQPQQQPPAYRQDPGANMQRQAPDSGWQRQSSICLELEQRLVQESKSGGTRQRLPQLEAEIRELRRKVQASERNLESGDCYEYFIFSKSLRRNSRCMGLANEGEAARRQLAQLEGERQDIVSRSNRSYQDEIIRELARNGCGDSYAQESRRRDRQAFSPFWQDEESSGGSGYANSYNALPFATYRTLCVRLCDGYYFPVSFSTLPNHFQRDAEICQSRCASPAALYYHQNPGAGVEQMVAFGTNEPYTKLKVAFRYRKEYINGCSCKESEYIPQTPMPGSPDQQIDGAAPVPGDPDRRAEGPTSATPLR